MKFGFSITGRGPLTASEAVSAIARRAEELEFDLVLAPDHLVVPKDIGSIYPYTEGGEFPGGVTGEAIDQLTTLAFMAGQTSRIRLGTSVMIVPHRNPVLAAKMLATLDMLSQGRIILGVGAGWMREEFEALGLPPFEERGDVTDEYIRVFKELWTSDDPSFDGKYCSFSNITFQPKPVQKPHIPIWVGGESPRALRRAAELGNGWSPIGSNPQFPLHRPEQLEAAIGRLAERCRRVGRDPGEVEIVYRTHQYRLEDGPNASSERLPFTGSAEQVAGDVHRYEEMGVRALTMDFARLSSNIDEMLHHMEEFATRVRPLV